MVGHPIILSREDEGATLGLGRPWDGQWGCRLHACLWLQNPLPALSQFWIW